MSIKSMLSLVGVCLFISSLSSNAALIGRDLDGDNTTAEAYYSDVQGITWLANANINGADTWDNQLAWASGLMLGGVNGWRLPDPDVNNDGTLVTCSPGGVAGCIDNEMGYLYWEEVITPTTPTPFINLQSNRYWYNTELSTTGAWVFNFDSGGHTGSPKTSSWYAWAVHDGDVGGAVVPVPAAVWLFVSGFIGLIGIARRKKV